MVEIVKELCKGNVKFWKESLLYLYILKKEREREIVYV